MTESSIFLQNKELFQIYGFSVITPLRQSEKKPFLEFCLNGVTYEVEIGLSVNGNVTRIANFFAKFDEYTEKIGEILQTKVRARENAARQIAAPSAYANKVRELESEKDEILEKMRSETQNE